MCRKHLTIRVSRAATCSSKRLIAAIAARPGRARGELPDAHGDDVLVVGAVEDADDARVGEPPPDAPQEVVPALLGSRRAERRDRARPAGPSGRRHGAPCRPCPRCRGPGARAAGCRVPPVRPSANSCSCRSPSRGASFSCAFLAAALSPLNRGVARGSMPRRSTGPRRDPQGVADPRAMVRYDGERERRLDRRRVVAERHHRDRRRHERAEHDPEDRLVEDELADRDVAVVEQQEHDQRRSGRARAGTATRSTSRGAGACRAAAPRTSRGGERQTRQVPVAHLLPDHRRDRERREERQHEEGRRPCRRSTLGPSMSGTAASGISSSPSVKSHAISAFSTAFTTAAIRNASRIRKRL